MTSSRRGVGVGWCGWVRAAAVRGTAARTWTVLTDCTSDRSPTNVTPFEVSNKEDCKLLNTGKLLETLCCFNQSSLSLLAGNDLLDMFIYS